MSEEFLEVPCDDLQLARGVLAKHGYRVEDFQFVGWRPARRKPSRAGAELNVLVSVAWPGITPAIYEMRPVSWVGEFERDVMGMRFDRRAVGRSVSLS